MQKHVLADGEAEALGIMVVLETHAHELALQPAGLAHGTSHSLVVVWQDDPMQPSLQELQVPVVLALCVLVPTGGHWPTGLSELRVASGPVQCKDLCFCMVAEGCQHCTLQ